MAPLMALLTRFEFWLALILLIGALTLIARRLELSWWPAWLLRLAVVTVALLVLFSSYQETEAQPIPRRVVMVVDQSDSLSEETRRQVWQQALDWQSGGENRLVVSFGVEAEAVLPPVEGQPAPAETTADGRASSLEEGLSLAESLLAGAPGDVILATDGLTDPSDAVTEALERLNRQRHTLEVAGLAPRPMENDLALGSLVVPANLWSGTPFDLLVPVYNGPAAELRLTINGQESGITAEALDRQSAYQFHIPRLPEGMVTLGVTANSAPERPDPFPDNNSGHAVLRVFPSPRILLVTPRQEEEAVVRFGQVLVQNGIQVDAVPPEGFSTNLADLQQYRVILLDNLLSSQLSREQIVALRVFTSRLAGGLVFLGGRSSYTLGGYQGTPLEAMLPVKLEPPPRTERPPMVFELILDRSSSMKIGASRAGQQPIALAREAAMRSIEMLRAEDYLGVLTFSDEPNWEVPLRPIGDAQGLRQALDAVSQVEAEGGTYMFQAMQEALASMAALPPDAPANRHVLILSDGQSFDGEDEEFRQLAEAAQAQGVTISTIALGEDADNGLLEEIAVAGKGRFYAVRNADDLPRILLSESQAARSENVQAGDTSLKSGEPGHPILSGLSPSQLPVLSGYNALRSRGEEGAEDVLVSSSFDDPILSAWQYGLGRVVAWMGDVGGEWTGNWPDAAAEGMFWSQVIRYALPNPALGPAQVNVQVEPDTLIVEAALFTARGDPLNLAEVTFTFSGADGTRQSYRLLQERSGIYRLEIPRPPDGAYRGVITYIGEDGQPQEHPSPFAVNPPAEWLPENPSRGQVNLTAWAMMTGGAVTGMEQVVGAGEAAPAPQPLEMDDVWQRLLLVLVLLWPMEVAIRRRWLPWIY